MLFLSYLGYFNLAVTIAVLIWVLAAYHHDTIKPPDHKCSNAKGGRRCDICFGPITKP